MKIKALVVGAILFAVHPGYASTPVDLDLNGRVTLPKDVSAVATVLISSAQPKTNWMYSASMRYPMLPRRAQTDKRGDFRIGPLDSKWDYTGFVLAPGCKTKVFNHYDPAEGPWNFSLEAIDSNSVSDAVLRGRVLDDHNHPLAGALITMQEVTRDNIWHFSADNIDQFSVSDEGGDFYVYGRTPFTDASGAVEAPGFATALFEHWEPGETNHEIRLIKGATLQGRLLRVDQPVTNAKVRLDRFGAEAGSTAWNYIVLTDDSGHFSFSNLPPNRNCRLHGVTGSLGSQGVVPVRSVQIGANDSTNDLGDLHLESALKVEGQIRLTDGKAVPANSFLYFGDFDEGMSLPSAIQRDGAFQLTGVPAGKLNIYLRVPRYELTPKDSYLIAGSCTNVTIAADLTGWVINLTPKAGR